MKTTSDLSRRIARLQGRRSFMTDTCAVLEREIGVARARQKYREEVDAILDALEARFHARSLGVLEGLLSAFLEDVLPREDDQQRQSVSLQIDTQRGLPALQIGVRNGDHLEDALHGRGGSVANVLSAGLRFAALSRAGRAPLSGFTFRPFLILDEADCWIRHDRVTAFSDVVHQLAKDLGIQILMISHHSADMLKGFPVRLERCEVSGDTETAAVRVRYVPRSQDVQDTHGDTLPKEEGSRGFRAVRLIHFMSHADSDIPLHSEVTLLTGDNDVGKSAVTEAFRAICYNDASDTVIRHGEDRAEVVLTLENGQTLHWVRVRKGAPKTRYILKDAEGAILRDTPSPKSVPDWAKNLLGVDMLNIEGKDALDVQIGDQKSPVFLLDRTPSQRAAILDMGRESQHLRKLRDQWKKQVDADRRTIREGEKKVAELQKLLQVVSDLDAFEEEATLYGQVHQKTQGRQIELSSLMSLVRDAHRAQGAVQAIGTLPNRVNLPDMSVYARITAAERQVVFAERQKTCMAFWASSVLPQKVERLPAEETHRLVTRAEETVGLPHLSRMQALWGQWTMPEQLSLPSPGRLSEKATLARSVQHLWRAKQVFEKADAALWKSVEMAPVSEKTAWVFRGYQMGSEAQHLRKEAQETVRSLQEEISAQVQLHKERETLLAQWGVCPFCGQSPLSDHHHHPKEAVA